MPAILVASQKMKPGMKSGLPKLKARAAHASQPRARPVLQVTRVGTAPPANPQTPRPPRKQAGRLSLIPTKVPPIAQRESKGKTQGVIHGELQGETPGLDMGGSQKQEPEEGEDVENDVGMGLELVSDADTESETSISFADSEKDPKIYTDWANHYLVKSGHQRLIKDLQQDLNDGVLLAQLIQVVANEKIADINAFPKSRIQMIQNIDVCLGFLAAKGVNIQGLCSEEIRRGNLQSILGLFFSLSRYKQQQQQQQQQRLQRHSSLPGSPAHLALPQGPCSRPPSPHHTCCPAPAHWSSSTDQLASPPSQTSAQAAGSKVPLVQRRPSRLPARTMRVPAGLVADVRTRSPSSPSSSSSCSSSKRRSQSFSHYDKPRPYLHAADCLDRARSTAASPVPMERPLSPAPSLSLSPSASSIPQPLAGAGSKSWRGKSLSAKRSVTPSVLSVSPPPQPKAPEAAPKAGGQRSMLEKLKLFNSGKAASRNSAGTQTESQAEAERRGSGARKAERKAERKGEKRGEKKKGGKWSASGSSLAEATSGNLRSAGSSTQTPSPSPSPPSPSPTATSPKLALRGIAQRTLGRALTPRKSFARQADKDKTRPKDKEKSGAREKEQVGQGSRPSELIEPEPVEVEPRQEWNVSEAEPSRRGNSKGSSLIPKGSKASTAKRDTPSPTPTASAVLAPSGIPKPGSRRAREPPAPPAARELERRGSGRGSALSVHRGHLDSPTSSSCSSLASSSEGRCPSHGGSCSAPLVAGAGTADCGLAGVHLPRPLQQHSHPNTATVAPFMYRSQPDVSPGAGLTEAWPPECQSRRPAALSQSAHGSLEDLTAEDAETRRLRTVKNIADLRQNLEETMSCLRGTQVNHSSLEATGDGGVTMDTTTGGRGLLSPCPRPSSTLPWRLSSSSGLPRLQAGDAPSSGTGYAVPVLASRAVSPEGGRYLRRQTPAGQESRMDKVEEVTDVTMETEGYASDVDDLGKGLRMDTLTSGYLTDSGVGVYSPCRLTRLHGDSGMTAPGIRQNPYRSPPKGLEDHDSWDDSSSVSSGISDTFDADDIAGSSVPCRDIHLKGGKLRTDTEKQEVRRSDLSGSDSGVKMESGSKWGCRHPSDLSDESERSSSGRKTPTIGHTGSWRRGMSAQVGVTSPRTKPSNASSSTLPSTSKTLGTGKTDDAKVSERGCLSPGSRSNGLQRSPSSGGDEPRKPSSGSGSSSARTPTSTFGFKKHSAAGGAAGGGSIMTLVTASGGTITSGSATLGKIPRSSLTGSLQYSNGAGTGRALSRQASVDDGYLSANGKHSALQYRSLPRPSRTSSGHTGIGTNGRSGAARGSIAGVDVSLGARAATIHGSKRNGVSRASLGANQTDREKGVAVEGCAPGEAHSAGMPAGSLPPSGARQAGGKYPDVASPTLRRLFGGAKSAKQAPLAGPDGMKSSAVLSNPHAGPGHQGGALHSPSPSASSGASSPLYGGGRTGGLGVELGLSPLASSPGSALSTPSHSLAWSSGYPSPGYPSPGCFPSSLGSLATSSESMDVSLGSVGGGGGESGLGGVSSENTALQTRANGVKAGYSDSPLSSPSASPKLGRNTLPRKQDRYAHLSPLRSEEPRDWLRSHSTGGVQESAACSPFSPSSSLSSPSGTRYNFTQLAGSPTTAANQMSLANLRVSAVAAAASGLAPQDGGEAYSDARLRSSNMSLEEKSRTISTSGSFRDGLEEVHGSSLSLVSSTSSVYSTPEEKSQSEIRKLRRELEASQEKVSALTTQLSANAHLVAAFEQSLSNMTLRLHSLTTTAEQKDGELNTLKKTIDSLKRQHSVTQAAINTAINAPETCAQDPNSPVSGQASPVSPLSEACIRRQPSSDSMASLTSQTSHSSLGSANDLHSNGSKKKQKKNWLRSSFKQAFGKKKSSKASSQSDMEESLADLSLPSSPQLSYQPRHQATSPKSYQHNPSSPTSPGLRSSHSNSLISECVTDGASDAETVMQLRSELRDKEMKLTDIRLEALSSAHQLDTLREAMSRMQGEMDALKQENSQLRVEAQQQSQPLSQTQQAQPWLQDSSSSSRAGPQPSVISPTLGQIAPSLTHTEFTSLDMLLEDSGDSGSRKEGRHVKVVVTLDPGNSWTEECRPRHFLIGCIGVSGKTRWDVLDGVVRRLFKEYIIHVDPSSQLGLNSDSVLGYSIGEIQRRAGTHTPELLPCGYLVGHSNTISVSLKDSTCHSEDSLVFETLIPRPIVQRYLSQLQEHRRIILSGPSGTGKSYLASRLAEHMVQREGLEVTPGVIATFNVDHESSKELHQYLCNLADQSSQTADMLPLVVILENLHHLPSLTDLFNGLLHGKNHRCPYIIGTMIQASSSTPNLQLHQNFRWVLCSHHVEPVKGFLGRFLRRTLLETEMSSRCRNAELVKVVDWLPSVWQHLNRFLERHSSPDVAIGPRLFLSCPMAVEASRVWFTDLWNYSLIPYLLEAVREGLQLYGRRAEWDNPTSWVLDSFPWSSSPAHQDWPQLLQLRPEDVGFHGYPITRDGCADTNTTQTDTDTDPLMNMLLRLKEAAHAPVPQSSYHSNGHQGNTARPSPESSL